MTSRPSASKPLELPIIPAKHHGFIQHVAANPEKSMHHILEPYKEYDSRLREIFAQQPDHVALLEPNHVPLFQGSQGHVKIRVRNMNAETEKERQRYLLPLDAASRKPSGAPAIVQSLKDFQTNFNIFSESALADLDWSNVVVAGSAALTPLLPVPTEHASSKRALRQYYHETIAPASDVDLFLYGLSEEEAVEKIKQIEQHIRDSILTETTTIRTKNAITIASQYPTRHIQIVLRIYRSISEILTGFDVDCSCVAYDGQQVYASPRALAACMTQINTIDLTRRSPSYESRLSKYSHRGFEVYWPLLDRSRIDPTIFERNFSRVVGLARLLVLEKLPSRTDREAYQDQRRAERGRPRINRYLQRSFILHGNIKEQHDDEIAEWVEEEEASNYHTFTIPYGPKYYARKIEKLLYKKDLLLNAEWNKPKDREVNLHRHPAFFGSADDVKGDCCGHCPKPRTPEEHEVYEQESKRFVSGAISFLKDDPGRQAIGSFHPLTNDDWTEMGYIGNTAVLCNAIVDQDLETVQDWLSQEGADPNRRDHTGRAPIHLAVMVSSLEIVQCLIDHGVRIVARLADGKTALHIAAMRGKADMVSALLEKSEDNEEEEQEKKFQATKTAKKGGVSPSATIDKADGEESDASIVDGDSSDGEDITDAISEGSYVKVRPETKDADDIPDDTKNDDPDVYDVDVLAWDLPVSPLHLAIVNGHINVVTTLISDGGASPLLPVKLVHEYNKSARAAILPLVLALVLPPEKAEEMIKALLSLGASVAQGDLDQVSALHYFAVSDSRLLQTLLHANKPMADRAVKHLALAGPQWNLEMANPLISGIRSGDETSVRTLLEAGAKPQVDFASYLDSWKMKFGAQEKNNNPHYVNPQSTKYGFESKFEQPVIVAASCELPSVVWDLVDSGADCNTMTPDAYCAISDMYGQPRDYGKTLLDIVEGKIDSLKKYKEDSDLHDQNRHGGYFHYHNAAAHDEPPIPLEADMHYLSDLEPGSYAYWAVSEQLRIAKVDFSDHKANHERWLKEKEENRIGLAEKTVAVHELLEKFEDLAQKLLKKGARRFKDMHPEAKEPYNYNNHNYSPNKPPKKTPWKPAISFRDAASSGEREDAYRKLFEACFTGDIDTIKILTLTVMRNEDTEQPPLQVSVVDRLGYSPFHICILRGHFEAARIVLEIARIQYSPPETTIKHRYTLANEHDSEDGSSQVGDDHDIEIRSEIIDDQFTVDNIGEVHLQVKSRTKPLDLLQAPCPSSSQSKLCEAFELMPNVSSKDKQSLRLLAEEEKPRNLLQFAAAMNDQRLLMYLLDLAENEVRRKLPGDAEDASAGFFSIAPHDFHYLVQRGHAYLLAKLVKRTGAGVPLDDLAKKSGIETAETPKYYQGLSVYGKKRADWAQLERGARSQQLLNSHPPLLEAARRGSLSSVKWFQSSEAKSCYSEFTSANQNDKRLKSLAQSSQGLETSISKWLSHHSHLLMHCVVLGQRTRASVELLKYLIDTQPSLLEARSLNGQTPLHLAFAKNQQEMIKLLIAAGADQTCRDKAGKNIMHAALVLNTNVPRQTLSTIMNMLSLIDRRLIASLCVERASTKFDSVTPVAHWYGSQNHHTENSAQILQAILTLTEGTDLDVIDGAGDTPLHTAARAGNELHLRVMLDVRPDLLHRENAVGRTPCEIAQDAYLSEAFADPPDVPGIRVTGQRRRHNRNADKEGILGRAPKTFVNAEEDSEPKSDAQRVWELCRQRGSEANEGVSRKRKLVSLQEANEVAKRLATREKSNKRHRRHREEMQDEEAAEEVVTDEVEQWYMLEPQRDDDI